MNILQLNFSQGMQGGVFMSITFRDIALISCQKKTEVKEVNHIIFLDDCIMTMPFFVRRASSLGSASSSLEEIRIIGKINDLV